MKKFWFKEYKWIYVPISWQGYLLSVSIFIFNIQVFMAVDRHAHSVSDTLYGIFPYLVASLGILLWIAGKTSKSKK